ncbi:MAG: hypothetical protein WD770_07705 [Actinomycetota bacterium]
MEQEREGSMAERPDREDGLSAGELGGQTDPRDESEQHDEKTQDQIGEAMDSGDAGSHEPASSGGASEGGGDGGAAGGKSRQELLADEEAEQAAREEQAAGNGQAAGSNE